MIRDLFTSLGRMARWAIVFGAFMSIVGLMIIGSKVGSWVTDAQQTSRAAALDTRETELRKSERAAIEKREADIVAREAAAASTIDTMRAERDRLRQEIDRLKGDTTKAASDNRVAHKKLAETVGMIAVDSMRWKLTWVVADGRRGTIDQLYTTYESCTAAGVGYRATYAGLTYECALTFV